MDEKTKKQMQKQQDNINSMISDGKRYLREMKKIQRACEMLQRIKSKKKCPEFAEQIQDKVSYVKNSIDGLKHPFWAYLKGAAKYARFCGSCDPRAQKKFCPLMNKALKRYDAIY